MRSYLIPIGLIAALGACNVSDAKEGTPVASSGTGATRSFAASGFEKVSLRGPDNVIVRVGPAASVVATGPSEVLDKLEIEVVDGGLRVGRKRESGIGWSRGDKGVTVTVTLPKLVAASVAGSGDMAVDRADAASFDMSVAGSGTLRLDALRSDTAAINLAGSGDAIVGGSAKSLDVSVAGSGDVDAAGFKSEHASIEVAGSGNVKAGVDGDADVSIIGSGDVEIVGKAKCKISKLGSGDVTCTG